MFLLDSGRFATDPDGVSGQLISLLESTGATVAAHRPWQDGRLAYEIEGRRKGLHYLVYFRMGGEGHSELNRLCKLSDVVVRHLIIRHPQVLFDAMVDALTVKTGEQTETEDGAATGAQSTEAKNAEAGSQAAEPPADADAEQPEAIAVVGGDADENK